MEEIAAEAAWSQRCDWENPISDTHTLGTMTLAACTDYGRGFAAVLDADQPSVYAHLALARAVLETAVVCAWLNEPSIDVAERVRRGLSEQLYSAAELARLEIQADAGDRVEHWTTTAQTLGWSVSRQRNGKPLVDGVGRPPVPAGIDALVGAGDESSFGRVQWSYLSAVLHGTWYGLNQALSMVADVDRSGMATVAYGASSQSVFMQTICVMRALVYAADRHFVLMGWADDDRWTAAKQNANVVLERLLN